MDGGKEGKEVLGIASSDAAPLHYLQRKKCVLVVFGDATPSARFGQTGVPQEVPKPNPIDLAAMRFLS